MDPQLQGQVTPELSMTGLNDKATSRTVCPPPTSVMSQPWHSSCLHICRNNQLCPSLKVPETDLQGLLQA